MGLSSGHTGSPPSPRRGTQILPKAYEKSERLGLEFWDPRRLASHVLATLFPGDQRAAAVNFILEMKITGSFLAHFTCQIEELLPEEDCELVHAIARTIPKTFWVPFRAPRVTDRYSTLREITETLRSEASRSEEADVAPSAGVAEFAAPSWVHEEEEKVKAEEEEDVLLPESVPEEDAASTYENKGMDEYQDDGDARHKGNRESEGVGSGSGEDTNILCLLWAQISLASHAVSGPTVSGRLWNLSSSFFVGSRDEDDTVLERTVGPGAGRAGISSRPRGGSMVQGWMLRCVGLYGV